MKKKFTNVDFEMFVMPFGAFATSSLEEMPASYVLWIMEEDFCPPVLKAWGELHEEELQEKAREEQDYFSYDCRDEWQS